MATGKKNTKREKEIKKINDDEKKFVEKRDGILFSLFVDQLNDIIEDAVKVSKSRVDGYLTYVLRSGIYDFNDEKLDKMLNDRLKGAFQEVYGGIDYFSSSFEDVITDRIESIVKQGNEEARK